MNEDTRLNEWFVPKFGPLRFQGFHRIVIPSIYRNVHILHNNRFYALVHIVWERTGAIAVIYALALGVSAHTADSIGSKKAKPWGNYFSKMQLWLLITSSLVAAYSIGIYYMIIYVPLLWIVAILEGFFVFAYNFNYSKIFSIMMIFGSQSLGAYCQ